MFKIGEWYETSDGFQVEFIRHIEDNGMYNIFRHKKELDFKPYYTDENGYTAYGEKIVGHINKTPEERDCIHKWLPDHHNCSQQRCSRCGETRILPVKG